MYFQIHSSWPLVIFVTHSTYLRQTQGIINATGRSLHSKSPSYGQICKRINKLNVDIKGGGDKMVDDDGGDEYLIISMDTTGIKITNRGQWMDKKWNTK